MNKYYFSFGSDPAFPFQGGYLIVEAPTMQDACEVFRKYYPDRPNHTGILNCAFVYDEDDFMYNWDWCWSKAKCHEILIFGEGGEK